MLKKMNILEYIIEIFVYIRVIIDYYINKVKRNKDFIIKDVILYERDKKKRVTNYFRFNDVRGLNKNIFDRISHYYGMENRENIERRLKFIFTIHDDEYIFYYSNRNVNIDYPMYSIKKISEYRDDIINPMFSKRDEKTSFYSFFTIDCKNIKSVKINGCNLKGKEREYFEKIKTPFNDFGLIYMNAIKVEWILDDLNIDKDKFKKLEIEFLNPYFNEEKMDFEEQKFVSTNIEDILITEQMRCVIDKRSNTNL